VTPPRNGLVAVGLTARTTDRHLWGPLGLVVPQGTTLAVTGPNGSGKSTLVSHLTGLVPAVSGTVHWRGSSVTEATAAQRRTFLRNDCGLVPQDGSLVPEWTVTENVEVVRPTGLSTAERRRRCVQALEDTGLGGRGAEVLGQLSGGERQRVAAARLLVQRPALVVADEVTSALDERGREVVLRALARLRDGGAAVVLVTHDPAVVAWCDAVLDLPTGRTRTTPSAVSRDPGAAEEPQAP